MHSTIICSALGSEMVGVWPQNSDKADVNCAHVSNAGNSVATGDDFGLVKIFQFPCSQKLVCTSDGGSCFHNVYQFNY